MIARAVLLAALLSATCLSAPTPTASTNDTAVITVSTEGGNFEDFKLLDAIAALIPATDDNLVASNKAGAATTTTCGSRTYTKQQVENVASSTCNMIRSNRKTKGYPHEFQNYENLKLQTGKPYYEFPILQNRPYTGDRTNGLDHDVTSQINTKYTMIKFKIEANKTSDTIGAAGLDRVIINKDSCKIAGVIMHIQNNKFTNCNGHYGL